MVSRILCALFSAGLAMAQSAAAPDPSAAARKALDLFLGQKYADLRQMFTPEMAANPNLAEDKLKGLGDQIVSMGAGTVGDAALHPVGANRIVVIPVAFPKGTID